MLLTLFIAAGMVPSAMLELPAPTNIPNKTGFRTVRSTNAQVCMPASATVVVPSLATLSVQPQRCNCQTSSGGRVYCDLPTGSSDCSGGARTARTDWKDEESDPPRWVQPEWVHGVPLVKTCTSCICISSDIVRKIIRKRTEECTCIKSMQNQKTPLRLYFADRSLDTHHGLNHEKSNVVASFTESFWIGRVIVLPKMRLHYFTHNLGTRPKYLNFFDYVAQRSTFELSEEKSGLMRCKAMLTNCVIGSADPIAQLLIPALLPLLKVKHASETEVLSTADKQESDVIIRSAGLDHHLSRAAYMPPLTGKGLKEDQQKLLVRLKVQRRVPPWMREIRNSVLAKLAEKHGTKMIAMHVRRGDKLKEHPPLEAATSSPHLLEVMRKTVAEVYARNASGIEAANDLVAAKAGNVPKGLSFYLMTNEWNLTHFDQIRAVYPIYTWMDFPRLAKLVDGCPMNQSTFSPDLYFDAGGLSCDSVALFEVERTIAAIADGIIDTFRSSWSHDLAKDKPYEILLPESEDFRSESL